MTAGGMAAASSPSSNCAPTRWPSSPSTEQLICARNPRPFYNLDVFVERLVAGVNHHAGKTFVNALFAQLEGVAVVQVDGDGDIGQADRRLDEFFEIDRVGILAGAFGDLEDQRAFSSSQASTMAWISSIL